MLAGERAPEVRSFLNPPAANGGPEMDAQEVCIRKSSPFLEPLPSQRGFASARPRALPSPFRAPTFEMADGRKLEIGASSRPI